MNGVVREWCRSSQEYRFLIIDGIIVFLRRLRMKPLRLLGIIMFLLIPCLSAQDAKIMKFDLFLKDTDETNSYILTLPTDMAFDKDESVFILDRREFYILKFDINGKYITSFGKRGQGPGEMQFPSSITIKQNDLFLLDSGPIINKYNLNGVFLSSKPKQFLPIQDVKAFPEQFFIGTKFNPDEMSVSLRKYDWAGKMINFIDKIDYGRYFTKKELSTTRSLIDSWIETLTYCINSKGEILYAKSNKYEIKKFIDGKVKVIISEDRKVKKLPNSNGVKTEIAKSKNGPYLNLIGDSYDLVQNLMTDAEDNIWFYTTSEDRSGFVKYSSDAKFKAFYSVNPHFFANLTDARFFKSRDYIYYIYLSSEKIEIYRAAIPK